ncbi:MAG: zinc ABC transporter substrate-binding protein, partial [Clostridiaceae bacterium]|nr:zinc ABC transporter substrate-binding protein [Clostridiaceae bacterium]
VEVRQLLLPGVESHVYEPTPQDIIEIQEADLFIYGGGSSDTWIEGLLASNEILSENTLVMMGCVDAVLEETSEGMQDDHDHNDDDNHNLNDNTNAYGHDGDHHGPEPDEHIWMDPKNAIKISAAIQDKLIGLDPENAEEYRTNYNAFAAELNKLDDKWRSAVAGSKRNTLVFADRFPFRYLTDAYGLEYYAAFPGCSAETEANPATIVFLINKVKDEEIPYIFTIEMSNQALAKTVAEATGAEILQLHSIHNRTADEAKEDVSYLDLMYKNLENVLKALN